MEQQRRVPAKKRFFWPRVDRHDRPFLQPLAVAIFCAVFIGLILVMGIMDMQRIDRTLIGFSESRAVGIVGVVERLTEENLDSLTQAHQREGDATFVSMAKEADSPQKLLITALVAVGREIDGRWKADHLSENYLRKFSAEKNLWLVVVLDKRGRVVFQSRSLPGNLLDERAPAAGGLQPTLEVFAQLGKAKKVGFIALRRKDGSGTIIIALDRTGLRYWGTRVSVQKAIEKLGEEQGPVYLTIMDRKGMTLCSVGKVPEKWQPGEMNTQEILSGRRDVLSRKVIYRQRSVLDIAVPFELHSQVSGIARIGLDRNSADLILKENRMNMFLFMAFIVLIALLSMWLLYHNQNRHLAGIVEMERQLEKAQRLSALGQLAAGVAHEIRNPLNAVSMASQRLRREFPPADADKAEEFRMLTGVIRDEIRRLNGIVEEFLTFSKSRRLQLRDYPVTEVLQKIVNLVREEVSARGITLRTAWEAAPIVIPMDVDKLQQALLNLVKNALESIDGAGTISLSVEQRERDHFTIRISDTGCGMTPEEMERIFSPDYTTKEKGLGLGLPLAHEIILGHGGQIRVSSRQGAGTTFEVILPADRGKERKERKVEAA
jgi:signal transduction histidine kinase